MTSFKVLVSGSRYFTDEEIIFKELKSLIDIHKDLVIIEGGAKGADKIAADFAKQNGIKLLTIRAEWSIYGKGAGSIRNQKMLDVYKPDLVLAFPLKDSIGTYDMIRRSNLDGYNVRVITE